MEEEFEVRANGETTVVSRSVVVLGNTSLRTIRPRSIDMDREAFIEMMRRTCQETSVWVIPTPEQVQTAGLDRADLVALAETVCRAAEHFPTP